MPKLRNNIAQKWVRVTSDRSNDYKEGVLDPKKDWAQSTLAAADAQAEGIKQAIADKRFQKGVQKAGTAKWQAKAATLGAERFRSGVESAIDAYEEGFAPYRQVLENIQLPPRYPKGDPRNLDRVKAVSQALRQRKVGSK